jgi:dTMP kinase
VLIALEGIDGSGKSTALRALARRLRARGLKVKTTQEPGRDWLGQAVRMGLRTHLDAWAQLFLFMADRAAHVAKIQKWEREGFLVLTDRYADSTIAYQSATLSESVPNARRRLSQLQWTHFPKPQLSVLLDVDPKTGVGRLASRAGKEPYERVEFLTKVRRHYKALARAEPRRWRVIDATQPASDVADALESAVSKPLARLPKASKTRRTLQGTVK